MQGNYSSALSDTLLGLHILGVEVNPAPSKREADMMFEQVKNEILAVGFDNILSIPRAREPRTDLAIDLLNDAGEFLVCRRVDVGLVQDWSSERSTDVIFQ